MAELRLLRGGAEIILEFEPGARLSEVLKAGGIDFLQPCGGRGVCGKCAVVLKGQVSPPDSAELKAGVRLACRAVLLGDAEAIVPESRAMEQIEKGGRRSVEPRCPMSGRYGAAVDMGTTTVVLGLYDMTTGECIAESGMLNPQSTVAADVMGRIGAALAGELSALRDRATGAIETLLAGACADAGIDAGQVESMVVTGNTTMLYLLTGRDPAALSHAPFEADCLFDETTELCGRRAYLPGCMHAFVGADITCAVLYSGMCGKDETALLCDVGTNGEIALWKGGELFVTSTAAGPAFEGAGISCGCGSVAGAIDKVRVEDGRIAVHTISDAPAAGVCGSGLIDAAAAGLALGKIDETGAMEEDCFVLADGVRLLPRDIRAVQLAKAAIAAGVKTLLETAGITADDVGTFYIAGGFGSHMDVHSAAAIGLFPAELAPKAKVLGNAALAGAAWLLLDGGMRDEARRIAGRAMHIDLGGNPMFNRNYVDEMMFTEV